jgi:hypothetical protein
MPRARALLLLPRPLEGFILEDQVRDLARAPAVVVAAPPRVRYGAVLRVPEAVAARVAAVVARRLLRGVRGELRAVVIFHPVQWPVARALLALAPGAELFYARWDRYECAPDATPAQRARLAALHEQAAARSSLTFAASGRLGELEREAGRDAHVVGLSADAFPAPDPAGAVVAISLGHLGRRTDWTLLRAVCERMPELVLLLVGARHDDECSDDADFAWCARAPQLVWLGARTDEEAARLVLCADVGIVPFAVDAFNDAALPYRILKYARLGRRTVSPPLAGVSTWGRAVTIADDAGAFADALRAQAGARTRPDEALRAWALAQTAETVNAPLWERLRGLGVTDS